MALVTVLDGPSRDWIGVLSSATMVDPLTRDVEYADEEASGQLALGVPGEQRSIPGLAKPGIPTTTED